MTPMTNSLDNQVQGKAVYLEFIKPDHRITTQVLVMPEGMSTSHKTVPMTVYRRRITRLANRKTWKVSPAYYTTKGLMAPPSYKHADEAVNEVLAVLAPLFTSLERNAYVLHKQIVAVEVTPEDLVQVSNAKTPYKILSRVTKSRKALGFPKETIFAVNDGVIMYPAVATGTPAF